MIWEQCRGPERIGPIEGLMFRLVESQEQIATLSYVDTLEEQALLEEMLEAAKPDYRDAHEGLHFLLRTPFRYPPLKWGSRFGRVHEPSLFYGGGSVATTLAESAFYRLVFWFSMDGEPIKAHMRTEHTLFSVGYRTPHGVRLQDASFHLHLAELTHPRHYTACQALGTAMREAGVQAFEYRSARDPAGGLCAALFSAEAFTSRAPLDKAQWLCETTAREVSFKQVGSREVLSYALEAFLVDGELPLPA
ncbi:RES family NAD+ phosphorylase [Stutzerimonas tarimensis]|uniref:RES family NAD+ phosphorylase n=1 Tax=Stutzerimonas tarimensis TaxID=1507735 RepID=A0ABV7SZX5_9GAMM